MYSCCLKIVLKLAFLKKKRRREEMREYERMEENRREKWKREGKCIAQMMLFIMENLRTILMK